MTLTVNATRAANSQAGGEVTKDFVTMTLADQMFGIPVLQVQDILGPQKITRIPLAPPEVAGSLNLRGRIVTAIDVRTRLGLDKRADQGSEMSIVVEFGGDLYSLIVDDVGEVMSLSENAFERNPPTLDLIWREISNGVYRLDGRLLVVVDVARLLNFVKKAEAA